MTSLHLIFAYFAGALKAEYSVVSALNFCNFRKHYLTKRHVTCNKVTRKENFEHGGYVRCSCHWRWY